MVQLIGYNLYMGPATADLRRAQRQGRLTMDFFGPRQQGYCRRNMEILGIDLEVTGKPCPLPHIVVANHISWMDILCLGAVVPGHYVAKAEIDRWPLIGPLVRSGGTLYLTRERARQNLSIVEKISGVIQQGKRVVLFPEGTTSDGSSVLRFHSSLLQGACRTGCLVQPVLLFYPDPADPRRINPLAAFVGDDDLAGNVWRMLGQPRLKAQLTFLSPLEPGENRHELAEAARQAILRAHPQG